MIHKTTRARGLAVALLCVAAGCGSCANSPAEPHEQYYRACMLAMWKANITMIEGETAPERCAREAALRNP